MKQVIDRQMLQGIQDILASSLGRIVVFTGARQVGKTTFVKRYFPNYEYISVEDPVANTQYGQLTADMWHSAYPMAILDEVQKMPQLVESVKATYEKFDDVRYILLGSSQILLLNKVKESLAGRCSIFSLYPLTLPELITQGTDNAVQMSPFQRIIKNGMADVMFMPSFMFDKNYAVKMQQWQYYLRFGGYPKLTDRQLTDDLRYEWLSDYVRTYLERDVRDLAMIRDLEPYVKLQQALATDTGQILNETSLSKEIGVTTKTVKNYLQYLSLSYQTLILPAWSRNINKRLVKAPKIHYLDNGVVQAVLKKRGGLTGGEFESAVVSEIYKQVNNIRARVNFYYLRTHDGKEVDLLIETQDGYYAFEIKMAEHVSATDARHLRNLQEFLDKPLLHAFLLSNDNQTHQFSDSITAVSAAYFLG